MSTLVTFQFCPEVYWKDIFFFTDLQIYFKLTNDSLPEILQGLSSLFFYHTLQKHFIKYIFRDILYKMQITFLKSAIIRDS